MTKEELKQENEKKKNYLRSYLPLKNRAKRLEDERKELRSSKMYPSVVNDGMPHSNCNGDLSTYAAALDELEQLIINARYQCIKKHTEILQKIELMEVETEKTLLTLKYLEGLTFDQISEKMNYSRRNIINIHGKALQHFNA